MIELARVELDALLALHAAFILFVVVGGLLALRWSSMIALHLLALAWGIYIEISAGICPLTQMEWALRERVMDIEPHRDFLDRYVTSLIYPDGLTPSMQFTLGVGLVVWSLCVYAFLIYRTTRARKKTALLEQS